MNEADGGAVAPLTLEEREELREVLNLLTGGNRLPWEVWTSCSFRRITSANGGDGDVLSGTVHRDGQPSLSMSEEGLEALVKLVNAIPALLAAPSSPTVSPADLSGVRARLEAMAAHERMLEKTTVFQHDADSARGAASALDAVIEIIDEQAAKVAASLSLLQEPRVGMKVVGEGFVWTRGVWDSTWSEDDGDRENVPFWSLDPTFRDTRDKIEERDILPVLRQLVSSGAAYVTAPEATEVAE